MLHNIILISMEQHISFVVKHALQRGEIYVTSMKDNVMLMHSMVEGHGDGDDGLTNSVHVYLVHGNVVWMKTSLVLQHTNVNARCCFRKNRQCQVPKNM